MADLFLSDATDFRPAMGKKQIDRFGVGLPGLWQDAKIEERFLASKTSLGMTGRSDPRFQN